MQQVNKWLREVVEGKTFAEVGGLWGTVNEKVTVAVKSGATEATMADIQPLGTELWERFHQRCAKEGVTKYQCKQADISDAKAVAALGVFDVVHCSGVLYHCPNPLGTIKHLAQMCNDVLRLGSAAIPTTVSTSSGMLVTEAGSALFVPALNKLQKEIITEYFQAVGAKDMIGINTSCDWSIDDYAPWWWLFTPEHIAALLRVVGFEILETSSDWQGRTALFLAKKVKPTVSQS